MSLSRIAKKDLMDQLITEATKSAPIQAPKKQETAGESDFDRIVEGHSNEIKKREAAPKAEGPRKKEKKEAAKAGESEETKPTQAREAEAPEEGEGGAEQVRAGGESEASPPDGKADGENDPAPEQEAGQEQVGALESFDASEALVAMQAQMQARAEAEAGVDEEALSTVGERVEEGARGPEKTVSRPAAEPAAIPAESGRQASHEEISRMTEDLLKSNAAAKVAGTPEGEGKAAQQGEAPQAQKNFFDSIAAVQTSASHLTGESALDLRNIKPGAANAQQAASPLEAAKAAESAQAQATFAAAVKKAGKALGSTREGKIQVDKSIQTQVVETLRSSIQSKKNEVEIQLDPAEWGSIQVKVEVRKTDIQVSFLAEHAFVKEAIDRGLAGLRQAFAQEGLNLGQVSVGVGNGQGFKEHQERASENSQREAAREAAPVKAAAGPAARSRDARSSLVDQVI